MNEIKIISEDDEFVEYEFTQPNDLVGDVQWWTEEDRKKWDEKMERLEKEGIKGQLETFRIKLKKNPFIDGTNFTGYQSSEDDGGIGLSTND